MSDSHLKLSSRPLGHASPRMNRSLLSAQRPQFSGVLDAAARFSEFIDASKIRELLFTDIGFMVVPRTGIELGQRGPDAGRETFIREIAGTFFNVLLVSWLSKGGLKLLNNHSLLLNPKGMYSQAWINAKSLKAFESLFDEILKDPQHQSVEAAREAFIETFLKGLQSGDSQMMQETVNALRTAGSAEGTRAAELLHSFNTPDSAKYLSEDAVNALKSRYALSDDVAKGTFNYQKYLSALPDQDPVVLRQAFLKKSKEVYLAEQGIVTDPNASLLKRSWSALWNQVEGLKNKVMGWFSKSQRTLNEEIRSAGFIEQLKDQAISGGLSSDVDLWVAGERKLKEYNLKTLLEEAKHFLEQFVDPAFAASKDAYEPAVIRAALSQKAESSGITSKLWKWLIPVAEDGLIPYAMKLKRFLTVIPILLTIAVSVSVPYVNNAITRMRNHGVNFFPGEGVPAAIFNHQKKHEWKTHPPMTVMNTNLRVQQNGPFAHLLQQRLLTATGEVIG